MANLTMNQKRDYLKVITRNVAVLVQDKFGTDVPTRQSLTEIKQAVDNISRELLLFDKVSKGEVYPLTVNFAQILMYAFDETAEDARDYINDMMLEEA